MRYTEMHNSLVLTGFAFPLPDFLYAGLGEKYQEGKGKQIGRASWRERV